jgi:branched-chain amino acid transport system permease protein
MLMQQLLNGIVVGSVYALFALGFTLIFGVNRVMNMAHGGVFMWGAFAGLYSVTWLHAPFIIALLIGALGGGLASVLLDWTAFRPLRRQNAPEFSSIVSSIGASLIFLSVAQQLTATRVMRFPFGTFPIVAFTMFGLRIQLLQLVIIAVAALMVVGLLYYLYRTSFGRQIRAVAFSEHTSKLLGINPTAINFQVFFISGALAGIAGVLIGIVFNSVQFMMGEPLLLRAFVIVVLGGLGSIPGALVAGLLIGLIQTLTVAYLSAGLADALVFSTLFLVLLVRPTGLFGGVGAVARVTRR